MVKFSYSPIFAVTKQERFKKMCANYRRGYSVLHNVTLYNSCHLTHGWPEAGWDLLITITAQGVRLQTELKDLHQKWKNFRFHYYCGFIADWIEFSASNKRELQISLILRSCCKLNWRSCIKYERTSDISTTKEGWFLWRDRSKPGAFQPASHVQKTRSWVGIRFFTRFICFHAHTIFWLPLVFVGKFMK